MLDITTLAAWGEFIGGIAVVVSLIYLAGQIRQNSRLLRTSTASATTEGFTVVSRMIAQDPEVARVFWAGLEGRESLSDLDRRRFDALFALNVNAWNQGRDFAKDDVISPAAWENAERMHRWFFAQPGARQWWADWCFGYGDEVRDYVDGLIREGEAAE
jgi:hypothetical protein